MGWVEKERKKGMEGGEERKEGKMTLNLRYFELE